MRTCLIAYHSWDHDIRLTWEWAFQLVADSPMGDYSMDLVAVHADAFDVVSCANHRDLADQNSYCHLVHVHGIEFGHD